MIDDKAINDYIQEGLNEIDKEISDDEEIRERARYLCSQLKLNKSIRAVGFEDGTNWQLTHHVFEWREPITGQLKSCVRLICANEARMKIGGMMYQPMTIDADIDADYDYEQALEAAVTAFVAKQFGKFIVEQLD